MSQLVSKGPGQESVLAMDPTQGSAALPRLSAVSRVPVSPEHANSLCHVLQCCPIAYRTKSTHLSTACKTPINMVHFSLPVSSLITCLLLYSPGTLVCWPEPTPSGWLLVGSLLTPLSPLYLSLLISSPPLTLTCRLTFPRTLWQLLPHSQGGLLVILRPLHAYLCHLTTSC